MSGLYVIIIQIHLMFLFNGIFRRLEEIQSLIQIHLMFLFNDKEIEEELSFILFKYISCSYLTRT